MHSRKIISALLLVAALGVVLIRAAEQVPRAASTGAAGVAAEAGPAASTAKEEHRLPEAAVEVARPFGFPITNSMVVTWIVAIGLIVFAQLATRNIRQVPSGLQNFWEWMVESLFSFLEGLIGHALTRKT